jgi:hypothetical protein
MDQMAHTPAAIVNNAPTVHQRGSSCLNLGPISGITKPAVSSRASTTSLLVMAENYSRGPLCQH